MVSIEDWRNLYERQKFVPVLYGGMEGYRDTAETMRETQFYPETFKQTIQSRFPCANVVGVRYSVHEFGENFEENLSASLFYPTKKIEITLTVKNQEELRMIFFDYWVIETETNEFRKKLTEEENGKLEQLLLIGIDFVEQQGYHRLYMTTHEFDYQLGSFQHVLENRKDDKDEYCVRV